MTRPGMAAAPVAAGTAPLPLQSQSTMANNPAALAAGIGRMGLGGGGGGMNTR